jgi:hypothetical protein
MNRLQMDAGNILALAGAAVGVCIVAVLRWALGVV